MIKASIYRTHPGQIEKHGAVAWSGMTFKAHTAQQVRQYCERLAEGAGIENPRIEIITE